jgi:hypothetical protein
MTNHICKPTGVQKNWFDFRDKCKNSGLNPKKELADYLRFIADIVETDDYPDVFGCEIVDFDKNGNMPGIMGTISVTLSYPWPG